MTLRLDRRRFLVLAVSAGAGLALGFATRRRHAPRRADPWLTLRADDTALLEVPFTELGQGTLLGITQLVAEELDLPPGAFTTTTAAMEPRFLLKDSFYTGGSGSIRPLFDDWRRLGATARALLVAAAAERWSVSAEGCRTDAGAVVHPNGRDRLRYGALAEAAARQPLPAEVHLKERADWRVIGLPLQRPGQRAIVEGALAYGIDTRLPGQRYAAIAQCPVFGGHLRELDEAPARRLPGVRLVVRLADAVAVVGDTTWHAARGLAALAPVWDPPAGTLGSAGIEAELEAMLARDDLPGHPANTSMPLGAYRARVAGALAAAPAVFEQRYRGQLLSHATLEPQNTLALVTTDSAELWTPTQHQTDAQRAVAAALGLPLARVRVHTTRIGGGFGRRLKVDYAVQAALVARAAGGPVQLVWDRAEDLQHGFYRPACNAWLRAALDAAGLPTAIRARTAATNDTVINGLHAPWYALDPVLVEAGEHRSALPIGAWRSVDASLTCFFVESFVDELAERAGAEPLAYRLKLAAREPRTQRVLEAVAARTGWSQPAGRALGLAAFAGWRSYVAVVAEAERGADGAPRVRKLTCAFDCGTAVNPALVRAQVEGGMTMALSAALKERISLEAGRVRERNFDDYPLLSLGEAPAIDVVLLESPSEPVGGAGEPPVPAVAPAVANAFYRLTGARRRSLPLGRA
ncbi:MAG TPA: molybdopterin cofactor-binding domain-containing protein [Steroidobacteraceae bacterium]|nr:molybdopterin cofactor-binding domain-containing protein [Steroidobacteraceae bacterium]